MKTVGFIVTTNEYMAQLNMIAEDEGDDGRKNFLSCQLLTENIPEKKATNKQTQRGQKITRKMTF